MHATAAEREAAETGAGSQGCGESHQGGPRATAQTGAEGEHLTDPMNAVALHSISQTDAELPCWRLLQRWETVAHASWLPMHDINAALTRFLLRQTIENTRVWGDTRIAADDAELAAEHAADEFSPHFDKVPCWSGGMDASMQIMLRGSQHNLKRSSTSSTKNWISCSIGRNVGAGHSPQRRLLVGKVKELCGALDGDTGEGQHPNPCTVQYSVLPLPQERPPHVLLTTTYKPSKVMFHFLADMLDVSDPLPSVKLSVYPLLPAVLCCSFCAKAEAERTEGQL